MLETIAASAHTAPPPPSRASYSLAVPCGSWQCAPPPALRRQNATPNHTVLQLQDGGGRGGDGGNSRQFGLNGLSKFWLLGSSKRAMYEKDASIHSPAAAGLPAKLPRPAQHSQYGRAELHLYNC